MNDEEIPLNGGGRSVVSRKGNIVFRQAGYWSEAVLAFLQHLKCVGFDAAPKVIGNGLDEQGRETLSYIRGVPRVDIWKAEQYHNLGRLIARLHEASKSFETQGDYKWRHWFGRKLGGSHKIIGHCDLGPWNIIAVGDAPVAFIDWEVAGPVDPLYDLAQACWLNAQLYDDALAEKNGLPSMETRARYVTFMLDGYGVSRNARQGFLEKIIEIAVHDSARQVIESEVTPDTRDSAPLWAVTWRVRSAAWLLENKRKLSSIVESS